MKASYEGPCPSKSAKHLNLMMHMPSSDYLCIYGTVLYLFPSIIKMQLYICKFVKSRIGENNNVCDVKYITMYTNLAYH